MLLRLGLWFPGCTCKCMTEGTLSCFLLDSHHCHEKGAAFLMSFCMHSLAQPATLPSQQSCRYRRRGSIIESFCGFVTVSLTSFQDHSDITDHIEPCHFGQEKSIRELLAGCYLYTHLLFLWHIALSQSFLCSQVADSFLGDRWKCHQVHLCRAGRSHWSVCWQHAP